MSERAVACFQNSRNTLAPVELVVLYYRPKVKPTADLNTGTLSCISIVIRFRSFVKTVTMKILNFQNLSFLFTYHYKVII